MTFKRNYIFLDSKLGSCKNNIFKRPCEYEIEGKLQHFLTIHESLYQEHTIGACEWLRRLSAAACSMQQAGAAHACAWQLHHRYFRVCFFPSTSWLQICFFLSWIKKNNKVFRPIIKSENLIFSRDSSVLWAKMRAFCLLILAVGFVSAEPGDQCTVKYH